MNSPKFKLGDNVVFAYKMNGKQYVVKGSVYIVDEYGTFEQDEEPSYDVMSIGPDGRECLYKHIRESQCIRIKCHLSTGSSISEICELTPKFEIGDKVRISSNLDDYYKRGVIAHHWTSGGNGVTVDMLERAGLTAMIVRDSLHGYILDIDEGFFGWPSELLTLAREDENTPEDEGSEEEIPEDEGSEENTPKFEIGDKVRISPDIEDYYKHDIHAKHWTGARDCVTIDMLKHAGLIATIENNSITGYILDIDAGLFAWPSELLTLVKDGEEIPEVDESEEEDSDVEEDETLGSDFQAKLRTRIESIIGKISDRRFAFILESNKYLLNTPRQHDEVEVELIDLDDVDGMKLDDLVEKLKTTNANLPGCTIRIEKKSYRVATMRIMAQVEESDEAVIDRIIIDFDLSNESYVDYLENQLNNE